MKRRPWRVTFLTGRGDSAATVAETIAVWTAVVEGAASLGFANLGLKVRRMRKEAQRDGEQTQRP